MTSNTLSESTLTPGDFIEIVKRRKWALLVPTLFIFLVTGVIALVLPPVYISSSTILIEEQQVPDDFVMATVTTYVEQRLQAINQRIMSYSRLMEIIERFNLYEDLREDLTDDEVVEKMRNDIVLEPISTETIDPRTGRATEATIAFTLSYEGEYPSTVQRVANVLASLFLEENIKVREQQTQETTRFLEAELKQVKAKLSILENKIAKFKEKNFNRLPELLQANLQSLNLIEQSMERLKAQMRSFSERQGYLNTQLASIPAKTKSEMDENRARMELLKIQLINLKADYSDEYPDVIKVKSEIAELEKTVDRLSSRESADQNLPDNPLYITLASQLASAEAEIDSIKRQIQDLDKKADDYRKRIAATPQVEKHYNALLIDRERTQIKYGELMTDLMEARVAQGLEKEQKAEHFTLIEPARFPEKPYKPNRLAIILIGVVLGIGAGVGIASLREFSDHSVRTVDDLMLAGLYPVLSTVPEIVTQKDKSRRRIKVILLVFFTIAVIAGGIAALHYLVMDLDIFWAKLMRKMVQLGF